MATKTKFGQFLKERSSTQNEAAEVLGISVSAMSYKANGHSPFKAREIKKLAQHYQMTNDEIADVFLT